MVRFDVAVQNGPRLEIRRTTAGRVLDAGSAWIAGAALGGVGAALYYAIDRIGRESAGVDVPQGYLGAVAVLAIGAGVVAVVWRTLRQRRWVFDRDAGVIALVWERAMGTDHGVEVPLVDLRDVRLDTAGIGRKSAVVAVFADGEEPVASSRFGSRQLERIHETLTAFLQ